MPIAPGAPLPAAAPCPGGRPGPNCIHPARVPHRSPFKPEGLAALLHAIAHIEFNAINLALDAAWRFDGMPPELLPRLGAGGGRGGAVTSACCASTCHRWATPTATSPRTTACGPCARRPRTTSSRAWRWCRAPWKRAGLDATPLIQAKLRKVGTPRRPARGGHPRHHPARRDRPRGDRQPLVPLAVRARGARSAGPLRAPGRALPGAAPLSALQRRRAPSGPGSARKRWPG